MHQIRTAASVIALAAFLAVAPDNSSAQLPEGDLNPLSTQVKTRNYLPHMTWAEVEEALTRTDMVIIPVGSIEQHGKHLPLGSDIIAALEVSKLIAQEADVLVAPAVLAGISGHHMGFSGTITLSPETFETVVYETAASLISHGFRKIAFYNGHGGNSTSLANVIERINQTTPATAVDLAGISTATRESPYPSVRIDWHAGVGETSKMMYLAGDLVQMERAENPVLTFPPDVEKVLSGMEGSNLSLLRDAYLFLPEGTGKRTSSREMSSNGCFTTGDVKTSSAARGKWELWAFVESAIAFLNSWKEIN
ncbi:MAG: creatininase family protein [Gemmatimonadota bacterium]|nr:MAG: creatininase family protein [Gemmatimonadota bacterium]